MNKSIEQLGRGCTLIAGIGLLSACCQCSTPPQAHDYFSAEKQATIKMAYKHKALGLKRIASYHVPCAGGPRATQPKEVRTFGRDGRTIGVSVFSASGKLKQRQENVYDTIGHKVKVKYYNRYKDLVKIRQFDEQGHRTLSLQLGSRSRTRKESSAIAYNPQKYIRHIKTYDENERLLSEVNYSYYHNNVRKRELHIYYETRSPKLREKRRIRKEYDEKGSLMRDYLATAKDTSLQTHRNEYDDKGQLETVTILDKKNKLLGRKHYRYAQGTQPMESKVIWFDNAGKEKERHVSQYNEQGEPTVFISCNSQGRVISRKTYQYDKEHGLLSRTEAYSSETNGQEKRKCTIYEYTFY